MKIAEIICNVKNKFNAQNNIRKILLSVVIILLIAVFFFSTGGENQHISLIKNAPVPGHNNITWGNLLDNSSVCKNPQWKYSETSKHEIFVQMKCNLSEISKEKELDFSKFYLGDSALLPGSRGLFYKIKQNGDYEENTNISKIILEFKEALLNNFRKNNSLVDAHEAYLRYVNNRSFMIIFKINTDKTYEIFRNYYGYHSENFIRDELFQITEIGGMEKKFISEWIESNSSKEIQQKLLNNLTSFIDALDESSLGSGIIEVSNRLYTEFSSEKDKAKRLFNKENSLFGKSSYMTFISGREIKPFKLIKKNGEKIELNVFKEILTKYKTRILSSNPVVILNKNYKEDNKPYKLLDFDILNDNNKYLLKIKYEEDNNVIEETYDQDSLEATGGDIFWLNTFNDSFFLGFKNKYRPKFHNGYLKFSGNDMLLKK